MGLEQEQTRTSSTELLENENSKQNLSEIKFDESQSKISENIDKSKKELLGSVTTHNSPGVRTSARVIQKMKQDSVRCSSPPLHDKKDYSRDDKNLQRTPSQTKTTSKNSWTNLEKNLFFDALNECGKDFDAMYNFINSKIKKSSTDRSTKTKEQIRQSYYQTFHKLSKYVKFSDEVKKPAQELYALINYGEMRRKLAFVSEKNLIKLRELVYKGHVTVRSKGKSIRVKTPSCKALRKLNQLEGWLEDIKLPSKVEVCLRPATMEAWGKVQNIAQNPVVRTVVPLQKKLINIIKTFQYRWRSQEIKLNETALKLFGTGTSAAINVNENSKCDRFESDQQLQQHIFDGEPLICFTPHKDAIIHRPLVSITQYLSSFNICMNSYEERIGVKIRGETLWQDRSHSKRQRTDSGCEKKNSPENKKCRNESGSLLGGLTTTFDITSEKLNNIENESNNKDYNNETEDELCSDEIAELLFDNDNRHGDCIDGSSIGISCTDDGIKYLTLLQNESNLNGSNNSINCSSAKISLLDANKQVKRSAKRKDRDSKKEVNNLKSFVSNDILKKIRKGWTILNAADITVGDLYIVFGQDSKLLFEYFWLNDKKPEFDMNHAISSVPYGLSMKIETAVTSQSKDDSEEKFNHNSLSNKLKHLLLIANLSERIKKKQCSCGHVCVTKTKQGESDVSPKSYVSNITYSGPHSDVNVFRQPMVPFRRTLAVQSFKQIPNGHRIKQPRFLRTGKIGSRQIVVQRLLPLQPGIDQSYDVVSPQLEFHTVQDGNSTEEDDFQNTTDTISYKTQSENAVNIENNVHSQQVDSIYEQETTNTEIDRDSDFIEETITLSNCEKENEIIDELNDDRDQIVNERINENSVDVTKTSDELIPTIVNNISESSIDSDLSPLLELSLPSPLPINSLDVSINDSLTGIPPMSPMQLLRESGGDSKWLDENIGDFSLTSFLGHLDEINNRESSTDNTNISVISESSVDYVSKFAEIASLQNEERDL